MLNKSVEYRFTGLIQLVCCPTCHVSEHDKKAGGFWRRDITSSKFRGDNKEVISKYVFSLRCLLILPFHLQ